MLLGLVLVPLLARAQPPAVHKLAEFCPHALTVSPAKPKLVENSDAWVTDKSDRDGILSLSYCWVFKVGIARAKRISKSSLFELPPAFDYQVRFAQAAGEKLKIDRLPIGYSVYHDLAFEIETEASFDDGTVTLKLPSVKTEAEFNKLVVLTLGQDGFVPGTLRWRPTDGLGKPVTDFANRTITFGWDLASAFNSGTTTSRVVVTTFDPQEYDHSQVDVVIYSVIGPPAVKMGETFSYSVTILNTGGSVTAATDVELLSVATNGTFVSAKSTQGNCRQSPVSGEKIICEFGTLEHQQTATVTITLKSDDGGFMSQESERVFQTFNSVQCREMDYTPENNRYESRGTIIHR